MQFTTRFGGVVDLPPRMTVAATILRKKELHRILFGMVHN